MKKDVGLKKKNGNKGDPYRTHSFTKTNKGSGPAL